MQAGTLRHIITIQEKTRTPDGMGGHDETWADVAGCETVPAAIWPISSTETLDQMKLEDQITHRIRIRYRSGLTTAMRVVFGSRIFELVSMINREERNISLDLLATEEI